MSITSLNQREFKKKQNILAITSRERLLDDAWLDDRDIFNFMIRLKEIFPNWKGLEDPIVICYTPEKIEKCHKFYRAMLSNKNHWIVVAGGLQIQGVDLCIYDSAYRDLVEKDLGQTISKYLLPEITNKGYIIFKVPRVSLQKRTFCGYFCLANITALCFDLDPEKLHFDELELREHYIQIVFESKPLTMFPFSSKRVSSYKKPLIKFELDKL